MSTWNLGINDVSEETQNFKNKLSSKESQIAAQQTQLIRQAAELDELKSTLNETLHKLSYEADRALRLDKDLAKCSEDLRNEKLNSQNFGSTLEAAHQQVKDKDLEARELQATLESLSHQSDGSRAHNDKLQQEKRGLEARVRELEGNIQRLSSPSASTSAHKHARHQRSSSLSDFLKTCLENELDEVRSSLSRKETDLRAASEKLVCLQSELLKTDNEKIAMERKLKVRVKELEGSLEEKDEELEFLRAQQGDSGSATREAELLKRVEEDQAKITALEMLLSDDRELISTKDALKRAEQRLRLEVQKTLQSEASLVEVVREKEEALDELDDARGHINKLAELVREKEARICILDRKERDPIVRHPAKTTGNFLEEGTTPNTNTGGPQSSVNMESHGLTQVSSDEVAVYIERLLAAIERLRGERDDLRRHVQFLETEAKFAAGPLHGDRDVYMNNSDSGTTTEQSGQTGGKDVRSVLVKENEMEFMFKENRRMNLAVVASALVIGHLQCQADIAARRFSEDLANLHGQLGEKEEKLAELELKLEVTTHCLSDATSKQNDLQSRVFWLESRDENCMAELARVGNAHKEAQDELERTEATLAEASSSLEEVQSERDSLILQITNLQSDLYGAQQDLAEAEQRYSTLQFHQLSSMSSNEVIQSLREQIGELDNRVLRRTEQIGIHQHDIKRLETNLRLQEERVAEMTVELEMLSAQKEAMVEDCADAREARDEAIQKLEVLEVEVEELEGRANGLEGHIERLEQQRETETSSLVSIVVELISRSRDTTRRAKNAKDETDMAQRACLTQDEASSVHQITVAFAASQLELRQTARAFRTTDEARNCLQDQLTDLRERLETSLTQCADARRLTDLQVDQIGDLGMMLHDLQGVNVELQNNHQNVVQGLLRSKEELQERLVEAERLIGDNDEQDQHKEALTELHTRLESTMNELELARRLHSEVETRYNEALSESIRLKQELSSGHQAAVDSLQVCEGLKMELSSLQALRTEEIGLLQQQLAASVEEAREAKSCMDNYARTEQDHESQLAQVAERLGAAKQQLESEIAKNASLQSKLDATLESLRLVEEELREEQNHRALEKEAHERELNTAADRAAKADSAMVKLHEEIIATRAELDKTKCSSESLQEEKGVLQIEITNLEAEIQRSISLGRFLESQVKDSERTIVSLKDALERTRADLSSSEKSGKAAEINLSLQCAQHERAMSNLQRELAVLRSKPNLEEIVVRLEERNAEMEESLKSKCAEIEENDDRFIELLKEKKKLNTKIDTLKRKVQNLQSKLTAAASIPIPASEPVNAAHASPNSPVSNRPQPTTITAPPPPTLDLVTPVTRVSSNRSGSGPSSLPRPESPVRKSLTPVVFKTQTTDKPITTKPDPLPPSSPFGKKRKTPDDYDAYEYIPPQGFTAECLPSDDITSTPPHLRRVPHSMSGFTPVRGRPTTSPKREVIVKPPISIADVTNKPQASNHQTKPTKRTWLGKIKGVSLQASSRTMSSVFEREAS